MYLQSKMASVGFRWLDILEKEFDKAFVDLDLAIGVLDLEEPDVVYSVRQKLCTLSSCFAQLTHKAQTIFQNSAKIEAELIHLRAELVEAKAKKEILEQELHNLLLQLHSSQLAQLPGQIANRKNDSKIEPDIKTIKKKLDNELRKGSPSITITKESDEFKFDAAMEEISRQRAENAQLQLENANLRNSILALNSEVYGAKLAAKYLDKELAGRIQQLQLLDENILGREMRGEVRDKLWRQLESEILLQRHKTVVRACRRESVMGSSEKLRSKPDIPSISEMQNFGDVRTVVVKRRAGQGLGISITGGREHGVPILISELEPNGPAALCGQLYIGDAILFVNDKDIRQACHREAVEILQQQSGDCELQVQYIAADDSDNSLEEDGLNFRYRFFDTEVCNSNDLQSLNAVNCAVMNTPTAPRTPESLSNSRPASRDSNKTENTESKSTDNLIVFNDNNNFNNLVCDIPSSKPYIHNTEDKIFLTTDNCDIIITSDGTKETDANENQVTQTTDLILIDNRTDNIIKLEDFKKRDDLNNIDDNFHCSSNSLNSENLSSPMQTSTDVFLDSEILSTDVASNDSQSPKNLQNVSAVKETVFNYETNPMKTEKFDKDCFSFPKPTAYVSSDTFSNPKSDQSLLNSGDSCDSSPVHKANRDYKSGKNKCRSKKYFGVKTLQSIFSTHHGYSDVSSTASEFGEDLNMQRNISSECAEIDELRQSDAASLDENASLPKEKPEMSPQFEKNIHSILSDIFVKNFNLPETAPITKTVTQKKSSGHGQNLRVSKALRLCPNDDYLEKLENDRRKEKLLARYVYNANTCTGEGFGDPDFGTPV